MDTQELFGKNAKWTTYPEKKGLPLVRKEFSLPSFSKATLTICGLGFFEGYLNGQRIGKDYFTPCFSDYFKRDFSKLNYPLPEETTKQRIYVMRYDVTDYLTEGKNALCVLLGGGWLTQRQQCAEGKCSFADNLFLCFSLQTEGDTPVEIHSDGSLKYIPSFVVKSNLYFGEKINYRKYKKEYFLPDYDDKKWESPAETTIDAPLYLQEILADTVCETIKPTVVSKKGNTLLLDVGKNVSGWLTVRGKGKVVVQYAEESKKNRLDFGSAGRKQTDIFLGLQYIEKARPYFHWNGFRYVKVQGKVEDYEVEVLHIPFKQVSSFETDNEVLNWLYRAYQLTELNNMHAGIPSDCPHREKLGYTGDGQLTTETALLCFDSAAFFKKWFADILDCQDEKTGHVQHTAPFMGGGGGPCGWGGAIVFAPYRYYSACGEKEYIATLLPSMEKWINHILRECMGTGEQADLIVRERKKGWCLGDWCTLEKIKIAEPFVNTYLFVKALQQYRELCQVCGKEFTFDGCEERCRRALSSYYWNPAKETYQGGIQGADFFMADLGLLSKEDVEKAVQKYRENGYFDTGIIGTEVLIRYLFENGYEQEATSLLCSEKLGSFGYMKNKGASTLWEYWSYQKSQDHPMFGSVVKYLFTGVAGIRYDAGFQKITVTPRLFKEVGKLSCTLVRPNVTLTVRYERKNGKDRFTASYEGNAEVKIVLDGEERILREKEQYVSGEPQEVIQPSDRPNAAQQEQIDRKYGMFLHFGINTFNNMEWSNGKLPKESYRPDRIDADSWVKHARDVGMKYVILITKHHDGFCLFHTKYTDYGVKNTSNPTDVVAEVAAACKKYGIGLGLYYSLWDRHEKCYRRDKKYVEFMCNQLTELLDGRYGDVCELWLDGSWTKSPKRWNIPKLYSLVHTLQPNCAVSVNQTVGTACKLNWVRNKYLPERYKFGMPLRYFPCDFRLSDPHFPPAGKDADPKMYKHKRKLYYLPFEATICIRTSGKWFWSETYTDAPTCSVEFLSEKYRQMVEQQNVLVINVPPNVHGEQEESDLEPLRKVKEKAGL